MFDVRQSWTDDCTDDSRFGKNILRNQISRIKSVVSRFKNLSFSIFQATQYESLPAILFGCTAIVGSALALLCPETYEKKLPDTIQEAKDLK